MWQGLRATIGTDVSWVPSYPHLLRGVGLVSVAAEIHVPPLLPGSPISRFWADTWQRSRGAMLATGLVDDVAVDAAARYLDSDTCAAMSAGMLTVWGWKPEEAPPDNPPRPAGWDAPGSSVRASGRGLPSGSPGASRVGDREGVTGRRPVGPAVAPCRGQGRTAGSAVGEFGLAAQVE